MEERKLEHLYLSGILTLETDKRGNLWERQSQGFRGTMDYSELLGYTGISPSTQAMVRLTTSTEPSPHRCNSNRLHMVKEITHTSQFWVSICFISSIINLPLMSLFGGCLFKNAL